MSSATTFPVCSFKRVFDTTPAQEVLSFAELCACLRRFELKTELAAKIERELGRVDRALEQALSGAPLGERASEIAAAGKGKGEDAVRAMRAKADELRADARREAKRDLRLWSPVLYKDGWTERGSEGVSHVSCLVLDHDKPMRIRDALAPFEGHFLLWHSTWSYTPEHPKFRIILPLAAPVPAAKWEQLWTWAWRESGGEIDRTMSGAGTTYALPATPAEGAPREAGSLAGPLLDPRELGIDVGPVLRLPVRHLSPSVMLGDPAKEYVVHGETEAIHVYDDLDDDEHWEADRASIVVEPPRRAPERPEVPVRKRKKTLVVDFDGVIHAYASGWKGATVIPDPPVPGALRFLEEASERFEVAVFSSRSPEEGGIEAMKRWLLEAGLPEAVLARLLFPRHKPPAHVYLDDRGWRFEGTFPDLDALEAFEPWHKRSPR